ncbi:hypothetical protein QuyetLC_24550 [Bacillus anthracis]|uniref:Cell wall anchor protein n=1 Tax=Bacillus anthracis TaxID=1392 RepID=A0A640MJ58_BACAN|nr:hypothetical protein QuyetLC_24550 [Bacillus anthracis]
MKQSDLLNIIYRMLVLMLFVITLMNSNLAKAAEYTENKAVSRVSVYITNDYIVQTTTIPTEQVTPPNDSNKQGKLPQTSEKQSYYNWLGWLILGLLVLINNKMKEGKNRDEIY